MEHEFEKIIRQKVNEADQNPGSWDQEMVWSKISGKSRRKPFVIYYAAASVVLGLCLVFFGSELTKQKQLDLELKNIELAIEQTKAIQSKNQVLMADMTNCIESVVQQKAAEPIVERPKNSVVRKSIIKQAEPEKQEEKKIDSTEVLVAEKQKEEIPVEVITKTDVVATHHGVQPIIGGGDFTTDAHQDKKIKIRLFRTEEDFEPAPIKPEPIAILSRKN